MVVLWLCQFMPFMWHMPNECMSACWNLINDASDDFSFKRCLDILIPCLLQITTVEEAKEFYPLFGLGANIALIFSGRTVKYFSNLRKNLGPGVDGWAISLKGMMSIVVLLGFGICAIYWGVNTFVVNDPSLPRSDRKKKVSNWFVLANFVLALTIEDYSLCRRSQS